VVPLAIQGYGSVQSVLGLPYKTIVKLVESTKDEEIQRLIRERTRGDK